MKYQCIKLKLNLNIIKILDLATNLQEMQEGKEHIKWHHVGTINQIQIVGDSIGEIT